MVLAPAIMDGLTPEMEKIAEMELGETPQIKKESLEKLKKLIEQEPDFYPFMDDKFLLMFLRCKKHDVHKAFKALRRYYLFKEKYSRVYTDFLPSELKHVMDVNCYANMHFRDGDGRLVAIFRVGHCRRNGVSAEDIFAAVMTAGLLSCRLKASSVCGCVLIYDLKDLSLEDIYRLASPKFITFVLYGVQDCLPFRLRSIHIVNETALFGTFYNMIKFAVPKKLKERIMMP
ncbi:clavesin-1-like [Stegodyphus dumicola]|uniref:clavesin-1-like n=1 Tax=Stegodyphus dumicola TaxID=202533 RepID=UPI0015A79729|nr:clavesin-1-like [Stegodyphus dumicola]